MECEARIAFNLRFSLLATTKVGQRKVMARMQLIPVAKAAKTEILMHTRQTLVLMMNQFLRASESVKNQHGSKLNSRVCRLGMLQSHASLAWHLEQVQYRRRRV